MLAHRSLRLAAAAATLLLGACSEEMAVHPGLVTPAEVHAFYVSHPALLEGRRLYSLREIVVSTPAAGIVGLEDRVARSHSLRDVESWLAQRGANFQTTRVTHAAEDIPLQVLARFAVMQPGDLAVAAFPEGASVWQLVATREAPLTEEEAAPVIEEFLAGRRRAAHLRYAIS